MLDDQQFRIRLAGLGLRPHKRQEGFRNDDVGFDAAFFEFDTVMETPRRARPSIRQCDDGPFIIRCDLVNQRCRGGLRRTILKQIVDVIRRPEVTHH